jgi:4-diphosphocytidyl-2-C-methyl-D-erythritol kinase
VCTEKPGPFILKCRNPGVPLDASNLVWKAAAALWTALGRGGEIRDAVVQIDKKIPVEAGLGGGSSDAAAALIALGRLWGGAPVTLLREVGATIGSDVPFFLSGGTALGLGRGEEIYPLVDLPPHYVVIVRPPFGVSTAEAYAWYDEDRVAGLRENREFQTLPVPWPSRAAQMVNDLEPPVLRRHQEIGAFKMQLREAGATAAAMSGSGSAVFGLFRSRLAAERAVKPLSRNGARALVTRTLTRAEHERRGRAVARKA